VARAEEGREAEGTEEVSDHRQAEIDRITRSDLYTPETKARLIKLVSMTREEMNAHSAKRTALARSLSYTITLTGEELEQVGFAASLNRRMLDRGPEHETIRRAFEIVEKKCAEILNAEWEKVK
jgi:hypothetical protein